MDPHNSSSSDGASDIESDLDSTTQTHEQQQQQPQPTIPKSLATLSLSLSLPSPLSFSPPSTKTPTSFSPFPSRLKIPSQISSISLQQTPTNPKNPSRKFSSSITLTPLQSPFLTIPRPPSDPSAAAAAGRRTSLLWFRADLRVHDHEPLHSASNSSLSLLPVFLFDPRDFGRSPSGFDKTGPYRAQFLIQSVSNLRHSLRARGSDLVVRIGRPETTLVELAKSVGAGAVYAHREVSREEVRAEERVEKAMEEEGIEVNYFWGSTLYHLEDLPFNLEGMPLNYGGFREKVKGVEVRKTIEALDQIKGLPTQGDVEVGEIPTLADLGLNLPAKADGVGASLVGGETEALERLKKFAAECRQSQPTTESKNGDNIYGANFSCKISPWLAMGCLSPRFMYEELKKKKTAARTISAASTGQNKDGMNWLMFELLWRDFFRFITKKYSSNTGKTQVAPATACTGALA